MTYTSVSRAVFSRENLKEDVLATEDTRDGVDTTGESLSEENHVGLDGGIVLEAKEFTGTSETLYMELCRQVKNGKIWREKGRVQSGLRHR